MTELKKRVMNFDLNGLWLVFWAAFTVYFSLLASQQRGAAAWSAPAGLLLAATAGLLASYILSSIEFFDILRIVPRKSDFLLLLFAMTLAGGALELAQAVLFGRSDVEAIRLALSLPVAAMVFFVGYVFLAKRIARSRKRRVSLRLRAEEAEEFVQSLSEAGLSDEVEILSPAQVLTEFAQGERANVDLIVFSRAGTRDMQTDRFLLRAHVAGIPILDRRRSMASLTRRVNVDDIDVWSFVSSAKPQNGWVRFGRSVQDFLEPILALTMLVLLAPVLFAVAIAIKATSPGPVFYAQRRTGYLGQIFMLYKFRSMRTDSEARGYQWAQKEDPRVTPVGRFIRKTRLDELPQLWNVVKRDMRFVGPRPERPEIYRDLREGIPLFSLRTDVRPGITGWAQVCAGYAASVEESRTKLEHDLYYIQHMSMRLDLVIALMTLKVVLFGNEFIQAPSRNPLSRPAAPVRIIDGPQHGTV